MAAQPVIKEARRMKGMRHRLLRDKRGFSLLEALIAIFILSIGVLVWMSFQSKNVVSRARSKDLTRAVQVTESRLDSLSVQAQDWDRSHANVVDVNGTTTVGGHQYTLTWSMRQGNIGWAVRPLWHIQVQTSWALGDRNSSIQMSRMVMGQ